MFDWLKPFQHQAAKPANYAAKTLAAYRLGMKAGGAMRGVRIETDESACPAARALPARAIYHPDDIPSVPLPGCPKGGECRCLYRPVMVYEDAYEDAYQTGDETEGSP